MTFAYYIVPAISPIKRLPGVVPPDGQRNGTIRIVAARGEFEPASFVVRSSDAIDRLDVRLSDLTGPRGTLPAGIVDVRVVKCWYQAGTAWHSYFADPTRRELVPELLLHDDSLVRVDHATKDNHLRVDGPGGSRYAWVSYTKADEQGFFNHATEPVADSPTFKPLTLPAGESKQFWLPLKIPADAAAGMYQGRVSLIADGKPVAEIPLIVRVLPFALPEPGTFYDPHKPFYVSIYNHCDLFEHMRLNANDLEQASRKLLAEYVNLRDHGCLCPLLPRWDRTDRYDGRGAEIFARQLEVLKASGLKTRPIFGAVNVLDEAMIFKTPRKPGAHVAGLDYTVVTTEPGLTREQISTRYQQRLDEEFAIIERVLGHRDVYPVGWDEPGRSVLVGQRETWRAIHERGARIMCTMAGWHLGVSGHNGDFVNHGGWVTPDLVRKWHAIGAKVTSYASPHTGPENPDFIRRSHGMGLYKADLDGTCNYMYYEGDPNVWNDFNKDQFRSFCLVYPTREGVIDTIAWEGFREAVNDVRYATKLQQLASEASGSDDVDRRYAGKLALQWLATLDEQTADLNTMRLEMIDRILALHAMLGGESE